MRGRKKEKENGESQFTLLGCEIKGELKTKFTDKGVVILRENETQLIERSVKAWEIERRKKTDFTYTKMREWDLEPWQKKVEKCGAEGVGKPQRWRGVGSPHFSLHNSPCSPRGSLSTHCGPLWKGSAHTLLLHSISHSQAQKGARVHVGEAEMGGGGLLFHDTHIKASGEAWPSRWVLRWNILVRAGVLLNPSE